MTGAYAPLVSKFSNPSFAILQLTNLKKLDVYFYKLVNGVIDIHKTEIEHF